MPAANGREGACHGRVECWGVASSQGRGFCSSYTADLARLEERALPGIDVHAPDPGVGACGLEGRRNKGERAQFYI